MIFPNEKKRDLWRYALRNNPGTREGVPPMPPVQPPRPPPPPHRPRPHSHQQPQHQHQHPPSFGYSCDEDSLAMRQTPPPPYSSMPCAMDCSGSSCQSPVQNNNNNNNNSHPYRRLPNPRERELSPLSCGSACDRCCTAPGCSCANSCDDMLIEESDLERDRDRDRYQEQVEQQQQQQQQQQQVDRRLPSANTFATMFRKCCGSATESTSGSSTSSIPATMRASPAHQNQTPAQSQALSLRRQREDFDALMKPLKRKQVAELLLAVKSRVDLPAKTQRDAVVTSSASAPTTPPTFQQCILIPCTTTADREQYVTASRLFFWPGLRSGEELKRLPACHSAQDCVYTCCNPLHWCRIVHLPEPQPPPYQRSKMLRLKDADPEEDLQNDAKSAALSTWSARSSSISASSICKRTESPTPPLFESFTTDGKDNTIGSKGWCQIAYWELAHRVGEFFHARTKAVNIYTDGIVDSGGDSMCLRDLTPDGKQVSSEVVNTRKKVGLGVTLSLECGDVWIYNRGNSAVFVYSPTLSERLDRVCKVMPGCCLKAFETNRAQWLSMRQPGHPHMGPIDWFSLKISFAKGWGHSYTRQDIMGCPCWVEVHFSHLR